MMVFMVSSRVLLHAWRRRRESVVLVGVCLGFFVILLDATAVNVALGAISSSLGGSIASLQWVVNAYTMVFGGLMLTAGVLGDRLGSRRVFTAGLGVFATASAACAAAPSIGALVAGRAIQGIGAAAILPCSLALIAHRFPTGAPRARALGLWGGVSGVGLAAGPVVGGALVSALGWRSVFLAVVPVAGISWLLVTGTVEETPRSAGRMGDFGGQILVVVGLITLTAALTQTSIDGWTGWPTISLGAAGSLSTAGFVLAERRAREPMLPLSMFAKGDFSAAVGVGVLFNFGLYGTLFCLALHLENTTRLSARTTGLVLVPLTATVGAGALLSGRLSARFGARVPMTAGLTGGAVGATLLALLGERAHPGVVAVLGAILGSVGLAMPAMTSVVLATSPTGRAGLGSAALNTARQMGGALGVALLGSFVGSSRTGLTLSVPMALVAAAYVAAALTTVKLIRDPDPRSP